jgi:DNA primase
VGGQGVQGSPFHTEKTPSFTVSPDRQAYHCFGCGTGGNVISFVMEMEKVSFVEAVRELARRAGVKIPETVRSDPAERRENDAVFEALRVAQAFFRRRLASGGDGERVRAYLEGRGLRPETVELFGLGFAPDSWDAFIKESGRKGLPPEILVKAGLARRREGGTGHYDYFRDRLTFPILGPSERILGFGGRALGDGEPKYLNSPETPVFRKSANLYGLGLAREAMRETRRAVLVEGYMDLIALHQEGARGMVAPLGTAFTLEQARILARYTPAVTLAYDGDDAGKRAVWQAVPLLWESGLRARIALLPAGDDPDTFVRARGLDEWNGLLDGATDFITFALDESGTPEEREESLHRLVAALAGIRDEIRRGLMVRRVAERAGLAEEFVLRAVRQEADRRRRSFSDPEDRFAPGRAVGAGRENPDGATRNEGETAGAEGPQQPEADPSERELLRLLLAHPELQEEAAPWFSVDLFTGGYREIARRIELAVEAGAALSADTLLSAADDTAFVRLVSAIVVESEENAWTDQEGREGERLRRRALADYGRRLRTRDADDALREVERRLREAQARGEVEAAMALLREARNLKRKGIGIESES